MNASSSSLLSNINAFRLTFSESEKTSIIDALTQKLLDLVKASPHANEFVVEYFKPLSFDVHDAIVKHFAAEQIKVTISAMTITFTLPQFSVAEAVFGKPAFKYLPVMPAVGQSQPLVPVETKPASKIFSAVPTVEQSQPLVPVETKPASKHFRRFLEKQEKQEKQEEQSTPLTPVFVLPRQQFSLPSEAQDQLSALTPTDTFRAYRLDNPNKKHEDVTPVFEQQHVPGFFEQALEDDRLVQANKARLEKELNRSSHVRDPLIDLLNDPKFIAGWRDVEKLKMTGDDDEIRVFPGFAVADAEQKSKVSRKAFVQAQAEWNTACAKKPEISKVCDVYAKYKRSKLVNDMNIFYQRLVTLLENSDNKSVKNTYYDGGNKTKLPQEAISLISDRLIALGHAIMFHTSYTLNKTTKRENWVMHVAYRRPASHDAKA